MRPLLLANALTTCALLAFSFLPAPAQDWAKANLARSPRHGEFVNIPEPGGRSLQAWVVYPEASGKAPVVVLIHEIFGMSDWSREMADEIAGAGYIVVEPDLLSGLGPAAPMPNMPGVPKCDPMPCPAPAPADHDHMSMPTGGMAFVPTLPGGTSAFPDQGSITRAVSMLPNPQVMADLDAAADYGRKLPAASNKVFVAGFCWGGGKSFLFATHRKDLSGAFVFYGPPPPADAMKNITAPVYGFYAGMDARISATVPQTTTDMKAAGKTYDPVIYNGAKHGFMRLGEAPDADAANTAARQEAFRRLVTGLGGVR